MSGFAKSLGLALAACLAAPVAVAADLPARKAAPVIPPPALLSWTGFYVGVNTGLAATRIDANASLSNGALNNATTTSNRGGGSVLGGQAGYQMQFGGAVLGLETDIDWSGVKTSHQTVNLASVGPAGAVGQDFQNRLAWIGTTRLRAGYAFDRLLPYVTGGVAYGGVRTTESQLLFLGNLSSASSRTSVGWTAGGGAELALSGGLSAKLEYLYASLPGATSLASGLSPGGFFPLSGAVTTGRVGTHIVRTGLNWNFQRVGAPGADFLSTILFAPTTISWTGFYLGANAGLGVQTRASDLLLTSPVLTSYAQTQNRGAGFVIGGQAGYDYQFTDHLVVGVLTDIQSSSVRVSHQTTNFPGPFANSLQDGFNWLGTTRARLGWAAGSSLVYLTGGAAYGGTSSSGQQIAGGMFAGSTSKTTAGWAFGAGSEYALTQNWSLKSETLYVDMKGVVVPTGGLIPPATAVTGWSTTGHSRTWLTRFGVNYRFGATPAPAVVAKY